MTDAGEMDALTGVLGLMALRSELTRRTRFGEPVSLLFFDLECFKAVNEDFGALVGDALLREVAQTVVAVSPDGATVFRCGGDEFAVLVAAGVREAVDLGERICAAVAAIRVPQSDDPRAPKRLSCSIGVAFHPTDGWTGEDLFRAAENAVWQVKLERQRRRRETP